MTLTDVKRQGKFWQKLLGLSEWTILWRWMTKPENIENPEYCGFCEWNAQYKEAKISISRLHSQDEEAIHTIIHELLHLRLEGHLEIEARDNTVPLEVTVNKLSDCLLDLYLTVKEQENELNDIKANKGPLPAGEGGTVA